MAQNESSTLVKLSDTDETIAIGDHDIRGHKVKDKDGHDIGRVDDLMIDEGENKVRFIEVESGGFLGIGKDHAFIPVDAVMRITDDEVWIDQTRHHVAGSPTYSPELVYDRPYFEDVYGYYGFGPYWASGYMYPW